MSNSPPSAAGLPVLTGQAAILQSLLVEFEANERRSTAEILRDQHAQLAVLAAYAAIHSPFFKRRLAAAGLSPADLGTPEGLLRLPILNRRAVQESGEDLHCAVIPKTHLPYDVARSSGSTGEPVVVRKTALNQLFFQANMMREHRWHQRDTAQRLMVIRGGIEKLTYQPGWGVPVDWLGRSGMVMGVPIITPPDDVVRHILEFRPQHINTYPNMLENIVSLCERENIRIEGVKHIWSISETLKPELRARLQAFFGATIEDDYSCSEIGILALQCPDSGLYHEMSESVMLEILDTDGRPCPPGTMGRVVATDLHNFATPLIRYDLGDYAICGGACPCGRGLPAIQSIVGRGRNLFLHPDGSRRPPILGAAIFKSGLPVHQFQLIQHAVDDFEIHLVTPRPLTAAEEDILREKLREALAYQAPIRCTYHEGRLPLPPSGKMEAFICRA